MAKIEENAFRLTGKQLIETRCNRKIIPLSLSAEIALNGGVSFGSTTVIGGRQGTGKTTCALQFAANAQAISDCKVFFFNVENRLGSHLFEQISGIDLDRIEIVMSPPVRDKKGEIIGYKKLHAQDWWKLIGDTMIENPGCVIIVDSISVMSTEREVEENLGFQGRGEQQKIEAQFCRIYSEFVISNNIALILLAQIQANTGGGNGPKTSIKMGNSISHMADNILFAKYLEKWKPDSMGRIRGHDINFSVEKSGLGCPYIEFKLPLRFKVGVDVLGDIITHAINFEIIQMKGAWYHLPFNENGEYLSEIDPSNKESLHIKLNGENNVWEWLNKNKQCSKKLDEIIREKVGLK